MQFDHRLIDDLARVAGGALGTLAGMREEVEARLRQEFQRILGGADLVTREEFEVARAMAAKARAENEKLAQRVAALEAKLGVGAAKPARKAK
jgi:BMFP domain-containing protein YqiC